MMVRKCLAVACVFNLFTSSAEAVTIPQALIDQATSTLAADSTQLSGWLVNQLKYAVPFNSTSGNVVPAQLKLFGFEVGVEGVVSGTKLDVGGLRALPMTVINTDTINTFDRLPFPMVLGHAKIGLPFGLDAGVRMGGIPEKTIKDGTTSGKIKNKVFGLDLRKKVINEGVTRPFGLTVGVNYTHADGSLDLTNTYDAIPLSYSGQTILLSNGIANEHADWKTNSVGVQAILNKKLFIFNPYIGASANRNSGDIHNSITTTGTASTPSVPGVTQDITATGSSSATANKWDVRALAGFELTVLPFVKLGFQGEYAGTKNMAGSLGLRIQFR